MCIVSTGKDFVFFQQNFKSLCTYFVLPMNFILPLLLPICFLFLKIIFFVFNFVTLVQILALIIQYPREVLLFLINLFEFRFVVAHLFKLRIFPLY